MSDTLVWTFSLRDQMSGPATSISASLADVATSTTVVSAAANTAAAKTKALGGALRGGLGGLGGATKPVSNGLAEIAKQAASAAAEVEESSKSMFDGLGKRLLPTLDQVEHAAAGAVIGIGGLGVYLAKTAVDAASFAETTKTSLEVVLNSSEAAQRVFTNTVLLAGRLPITTENALTAVKSLALAGWAEKDLGALTIAYSDAESTAKGFGNNFINAVNRIKASGTVDAMQLHFLPRETGIQMKNIITGLQQVGYAGIKTSAQLTKMIHSVNGDDFVEAMLRAQAIQGHGKLGALSDRQSKTLGGLLTTLESRKFELLMTLDTSPGFATFRNFISNLSDSLNPTSPAGRELSAAFESTFNDIFGNVFGDFAGPNGAGKLASLVKTDVIPAFKDLATVVGGIFSVTMTIVSGWASIIRMMRGDQAEAANKAATDSVLKAMSLEQLKSFAGTKEGRELYGSDQFIYAGQAAANREGLPAWRGGSAISGALNAPIPTSPQQMDWIKREFSIPGLDLGFSQAQGVANGINDGVSLVQDASVNLAQSGIDAHREVTQTHSPSRVFQDLGAMSAEGYALGLTDGVPMVQAAASKLAEPPALADAAGRGGGGAGGRAARDMVINLSIQVDARGATKDDANDIAARIGDALPASVVRVFDMLAGEYGQE
jgi:hypothetical protein